MLRLRSWSAVCFHKIIFHAYLINTFVAYSTVVMRSFAVFFQVVSHVGSPEIFPTHLTGYLIFMARQVRPQAISCCEGCVANLTLVRSLCGVHLFYMSIQMVWPGESFPAALTDIGLTHGAVVRPHMVRHPIFAFKAQPAHRTRVRFLAGVRQLVPVEVVDVSETLPHKSHATCRLVLSRLRVSVGSPFP